MKYLLKGIKICSNCGNEVKIYHNSRLNHKDIFCSKKCEGEYRSKNVALNCKCDFCGKLFHKKPSHIPLSKTHFCCQKCFAEYKKINFCGENNHQYGLKGNKNSSFKSDERITTQGYKRIRVLDHPFRNKADFVFEHRLIAEKYLLNEENSVEINGKKYLKPNYEVHHIDRNRLNNDVSNLQVLTKSEHMKLHWKEKNKIL